VASERILVVGPDETLLKTISEQVLLSNGFNPLLAQNQEDGLKIALTESPHLLLLNLPTDSSVNLLNGLVKTNCQIPAILMVEQESTQIAVQLLRLGVRDCIAYPFAAEEVLQAIYRVLGQEFDAPNYQRLAEGLDRINRELEQRLKEFDILFRIGRSVSSLLDLDSVLNRVTEAAVFITDAEEGYLLLLDEETGELQLRAAQNLGEKQARGFSLRVSDSIAGTVTRSGKPVLLGGNDDQNFKIKTGYLVKSLLNVPLKVDGRVIGVLGVDNQLSTTPFTSAHLNQLSILADIAAITLDNARQYTEMRQKLTINAEAGVLAWVAGDHKRAPRYISQGTLAELIFNDHKETRQVQWWNDQALQEVIKTGQPVLKNNFSLNGNGNGSRYTRSQLTVPMRRGKQVIGVIDLESSSPHIFTQNDLHFVSSVANQVAIALEETLLQEKAETERECLSLLMSAVDNAVWLVDTDLNITAQNQTASEIIGWSIAETTGRSICDLLPSNASSHELCQLLSQAMEERQSVSFDKGVLLTRKDNQPILVTGKVSPIERGDQVTGALCTFQKMSSKESEKYLRLEFVNMISHMLRTPLGFIQTSIDLLMNSDLSPEEQQITLDRMWERSQCLTEFTDELLETLRLETEEVHVYIEQVALLPLIKRVLSLLRYEKTDHQFHLITPDTFPKVAADPIKTELILFNLLTNAVNRCPEGGHITIEPKIGPSEVNISIIDNGESLPARLLDRIFGQFYPVDDENGKMPSTYQLGLYTTKRLVELQNGRIWAQSHPGQGSRFSFSLPIWEKE
jgi:PAS domain S-box-containing protein